MPKRFDKELFIDVLQSMFAMYLNPDSPHYLKWTGTGAKTIDYDEYSVEINGEPYAEIRIGLGDAGIYIYKDEYSWLNDATDMFKHAATDLVSKYWPHFIAKRIKHITITLIGKRAENVIYYNEFKPSNK